jgi:hypothetical protein
MVSKWTADAISRDSLYNALIKSNGHPYLDHKHEYHPKKGSNRLAMTAGDLAECQSNKITPHDCEISFQVYHPYKGSQIKARLSKLSKY